MQVVNKVELKLEKFEKCHLICDNDCPLGVLYDYSCALQGFILEKMEAAKKAKEAEVKQPDIQPE